MKFDLIKITITKFNFLYPSILGFHYLKNKINIKKNYFVYNAEKKLLNTVNRAIVQIPYYYKLYKTPISTIKEFQQKIYFIDKDLVMKSWKEFHNNNLPQSRIMSVTTGGTSGKPLNILIPKNRYGFELATMYSMWENIGWNGQIRAVIRNTHLEENKIFKINFLKKEIIFDGFRTNTDYYYKIYKILKRYNIKYIHAYPSSAYQFSAFLLKNNLNISFIRAFLCGSESLLPEQKNLIQNQLGIKIYHWYGHSEKLVLGGYCKNSDLIHIEPTYGYFELVDENNHVISEIGKIGEIVGTTFHNPYMPLIRYKTGDYAEYAGSYCPYCNRNLVLIKNIEGRRELNRIYYKDGSYTSITALNIHDDLYSYIDGMQYVQEKKGFLKILLIKGNNFSSEIEKRFTNYFAEKLRDNCDFKILYVNKLIKEPNNKFMPIKQTVK